VNFFRLTVAGTDLTVAGQGSGTGMRISRNTYLAVECLVRLASHEDQGPCTAGTLARSIDRSDAYMEDILARLRSAGLVRATRGPGGGYMLSRAAHAISVAEILVAMDDKSGRERDPAALPTELATPESLDGIGELWHRLGDHVCGYLAKVLLSDLIRGTGVEHGGVQ
jgi:Rrf2 family iron-sulfur cluster assembly transcriptional regulator